MKKLLTSLLIMFAVLSPAALAFGGASAVNLFGHTCDTNTKLSDSSVCQDVQNQNDNQDTNPIISIIRAAIEILSYIVGVAAVIGLIVSGIRFTLASDSNGAASARNGVVYSLIAVLIVAVAQGIVVFVLNRVH